MLSPTTTEGFLELVRKSELIPVESLDSFLKHASADTPKGMAALLVQEGLATNFQVEQLLLGKWRGFTIGKYRVLERLGCGGMGSVYLCEHLVVGRRVAVKVLPTAQADNPSALGRFYREARAAGVLDHPNLVRAHDIDQDGPLHFLVMDYIDGANLQEIVARSGPLPIERAAHYISQAAAGLQHAHAVGLVHRDVKPANILVDRHGVIRVLDLGLARFFNDNLDALTVKYDEQNVLGTADYVSPEQALNSHDVDIRADVYSLGCTFYFLLGGRPPFVGGSPAQKLIWHQVKAPTPLHDLRPDLPEEAVAVVNRMMAKDPQDRYQIPAEVVESLAPWTRVPIAPPSEGEMPRLAPALAAVNRSSCHITSVRTPIPASRPGGTGHHRRTGPAATPSAVAVDNPPRTPSAAALETPRLLASATPTQTAQRRPRPAPAVAPSRLLDPTPAQTPAPTPAPTPTPAPAPVRQSRGLLRGILLVLLILLGGASAGILLGWLMGRF